jgi:chromatin remodeling complex protein RSC6
MSSAAPSKSRVTKKAAAAPAAAVAAPAKAATPVAAPAKAAAPVAEPVVAAPTPVAAATVVPTGDQVNIVSEFTALAEQVEQAWTYIGSLRSAVKKFQKQLPREMKKASKGRRGRKAAATTEGGEAAPKKPSVFTTPTAISDALCTFLGVAKGSQVSRSSVTKQICDYAKSKSLMDKQLIKADAPLRKLFSLTEKDELKILNLQRYLKPHYIKAAAAPATKA